MNELLMIVMTYILIYVIGFFSGKMSGRFIVFGVSLKEDDLSHPEIIKIKRSFIQLYGLLVGLPMIVLIAMELQLYEFWYFMIFIGIWMILTPLLFAVSHRKVKKFKRIHSKTEGIKPIIKSASLNNRKVEMPVLRNFFALSFLLILITGLVTFISYDKIPNQVPMHYNLAGEITNYTDKSVGVVSFMILTQVGLTLLIFTSTYFSIKYSKRKLNPKKPETSALQHKIAMKRYASLMAGVAILINIMFTVIQFSMIGLYEFNQSLSNLITYVPLIIILTGIAWFFITTGMSGDKIKVDLKEKALDVDGIDNEDPYWKGGMIYYNKNDSSIFVQKRFGGGFTINFGTLIGKLIGLFLLIFVVLSIVLPLMLL